MDISEVDLYCDLNANSKLYIKQKSYEWNFVKKKKKKVAFQNMCPVDF